MDRIGQHDCHALLNRLFSFYRSPDRDLLFYGFDDDRSGFFD